MWFVKLALRRPYTFVVMALLIAILGTVSIARMPSAVSWMRCTAKVSTLSGLPRLPR